MKKIAGIFGVLFLGIAALAMDQSYESQSAQQKQRIHWIQIKNSAYGSNLPAIHGPGFWGALRLMSAESDALAFSHNGDIMINGREKDIHKNGTVVKFKFKPKFPTDFTGVFASGADGLLRLSFAVPAEEHHCTPGIALKFFIDTHASVNTMAMYRLDGTDNPNLFAHDFTNVLPQPPWSLKTATLECRFASALDHLGQKDGNPRALSSEHMASISAQGERVAKPRAPYELIFRPTLEAQKLFLGKTMQDDFRATLEGHGKGIVLYEVFARLTSHDPVANHVGSIEATSNFIASGHGDSELFFKHPTCHDIFRDEL